MITTGTSRILRYGVAIAAIANAASLRCVPVVGQGFASFVFSAVFLIAWFGGPGPSLTTTALIAALAER